MTIEEIRIECLRIAHSHGLSNEQAVERAQVFENFVTGGTGKSVPAQATLSVPRKAEKDVSPKRPG
jgi:hypothetical protein